MSIQTECTDDRATRGAVFYAVCVLGAAAYGIVIVARGSWLGLGMVFPVALGVLWVATFLDLRTSRVVVDRRGVRRVARWSGWAIPWAEIREAYARDGLLVVVPTRPARPLWQSRFLLRGLDRYAHVAPVPPEREAEIGAEVARRLRERSTS